MTVAVSNRQRLLKINTRQVQKLAQAALDLLGARNNQLSIVLVNDPMIAKLNRTYHDANSVTDVLSFDYEDGHGELVISVQRAVAQAKKFRSTQTRELALYIVHGILHLHGHNDRTSREKRRMRRAERMMLKRLRKTIILSKLLSS